MRVVIVLASVAVRGVCSGVAASNWPADILQRIADELASCCNCSVSIAVRGANISAEAAAGIVDFSSGRRASTSDAYAWGSGTKPVTGASILSLVADGAFDLDANASALVDPFLAKMAKRDPTQGFEKLADIWGEANAKSVTIRKLLAMQTGIPDFDTANMWTGNYTDTFRASVYESPDKFWSPSDLINLPYVRGNWTPGYSTTGFMVLGFILAAQANVSSWEEFDQGTFLPDELKRTIQFGTSGCPADASVVHGYDRTQYNVFPKTNDLDVAKVDGVFAGWTGSNMVASAPDAVKLARAIYGPEPTMLPLEYAQKMYTFPYPSSFYGLATFNMGPEAGSNMNIAKQNNKYGEAYGHLGDTYGFTSAISHFPELDLTFAAATNLEPGPGITAVCLAYNTIAGHLLGKDIQCDGGCTKCTPLAPAPPSPPPGRCCYGGDSCAIANYCPGQDYCDQAQGNCEGPCKGVWCESDADVAIIL